MIIYVMKLILKLKKGAFMPGAIFYLENFTSALSMCSYLCYLWDKYTKSSMQHFIVSYNNAFRILHNLPTRCSASFMFGTAAVNSCKTRIRKCIYSLTSCWSTSTNVIVQCTLNSHVYITSGLHSSWISVLCTIM